MDEMHGRVGGKKNPCWLWHAVNHENSEVVAYVLGDRSEEMLWRLTDLLSSINIEIINVYSDDNFSYSAVISWLILRIGKKNTQKIERKHLTIRTRVKRLARRSICYSKTLEKHKIMIGLYMNIVEFGCKLY